MYLLYFGDIPNLVSCAFSTIPVSPPFNSQNFLLTCLCSCFTCFAVLEDNIQALPKMDIYYGHVDVGQHQVRAPCVGNRSISGSRAQNSLQLHNFCRVHVYSTVGRTCGEKEACLNFLCLLPMILKTRGLGPGATYAWQLRSGAMPSHLAP